MGCLIKVRGYVNVVVFADALGASIVYKLVEKKDPIVPNSIPRRDPAKDVLWPE